VLLQAIDAMMFYQQWAPNLPDIITHRAGIKPDPATDKATFQIGGRVSHLGQIMLCQLLAGTTPG
jgi:hypothetical protein